MKQISTMLLSALMVFASAQMITYSDMSEGRSFGGGGGGGFRGGGGSSFSRHSYRPSGGGGFFSSKKTTPAATKTAPIKFKSEAPKKSGGFANMGVSASRMKSKTALNDFRAKFKTPATTKPVAASDYKSNPVFGNARNSDPNTYHNRRDNYYSSGGWSSPPTYVYNNPSSFGLWDTMFLYMILSNSSHAGEFAHNHQNDEDYKKWRAEADKLATDNQDLRTQLAQMDAGKEALAGKPVDPAFIPAGVDPDIALSQEARQSALPTLKFCVGNAGGAYHTIATKVLAPSLNTANLVVQETAGSLDAIDRILDGRCDAGFVQSDAYWNYIEEHENDKLSFARVSSPYKEAVHLICNINADVDSLSDLTENNTVYAATGSGGYSTWRNLLGENEDYAKIHSSVTRESLKVATNEAAWNKLMADKNACMIYVGAAGQTAFINKLNGTPLFYKNAKLVDFSNGAIEDTKDPSGNAVYSEMSIGSEEENLVSSYLLNYVSTLGVNADVIVSNKWKEAQGALYERFVFDVQSLETDIRAAVGLKE